MAHTDSQTLTLRRILLVIATGVGAGFLSGLFGVGGGLVIVPALMALLGMDQRRLPAPSLPWILIGFTVFVIVSQYLQVPTREGIVSLTPASCALLILVGVCAGILSGLVGVGGGSVIVPGMELAVGAGDLIARGTSLLVMIPTGIAGTVTNLRHRMVDLRVGLIVGASAAATAPAGRLVATLVSPSVGAILFNIFLVSIIASTILKMHKKARAQG
ncbi:TSUP family transporter [uncultured Actinomyces sp.]|uniref:TSUP family transporter n=1 Tax=uncultured Actinomyces sp. TaxID=249061 RepID=UPI00262B996D|nr:TSUP family transporter [uncultured Actinomyces sp.]